MVKRGAPHPMYMAPVSLKFLGTGGGRFTTIYQARSTGGCLLDAGLRAHIDPGPGALLRARQEGEDPTTTRAVLVTRAHPDLAVPGGSRSTTRFRSE
jgi:ribonuclease BN (tRNA processing enzyme)